MDLAAGTRLGPYEITGRLGAGGMGEVFRARDTRLERSVAIKVLPAELAENAHFRLRFEREAKTISQLNHPNICTLYDVGREDGRDYLVMELLEGESLADRVTRGPLPLNDVLTYGVQIAEALDKAHRSGIVHRDLKPGNIMLTKSGAKLLDFGLAKSARGVMSSPNAPTEHRKDTLTAEGSILGTFQYMAPEQLEGEEADARTDIFALGAVVYEMATGRRAFEGKTRTSLIAAIVSAEPPPLSQLLPLTPPALEHVLQRCLRKDPADRWQSAHDVAEELRWISARGAQADVVPLRRESLEWLPWSVALAALLAAVSLTVFALRKPPAERLVSSINAPDGKRFAFESSAAVLSPDGETLAFAAAGPDGKPFLWTRRLSSHSAQMIGGTEGVGFPFWSPDSRHIAFFADGKLKRVEVKGGGVEQLAAADSGRGGSWSKDDVILFAPTTFDALYRVAATGGEVTPVTRLNPAANETSHRFPSFLPDGKHFLLFAQGPGVDQKNVYIASLDGGAPKKLLGAESQAIYAGGYLLWVRDRILHARPFNWKKAEFTGDQVTIADNVQANAAIGFGNISVSSNGTLTYVAGEWAASRIAIVDREGKEISAVAVAAEYHDPRLSPDGKRLLFAIHAAGHSNLFQYDIARRVMTRFTFGKTNEWGPIWSPDGQSVVFTSFERSGGDLHIKRASGTEADRPLVADKRRKVATDWSPDGRFLLYHVNSPRMSWDIEVYSFAENKSRIFLQTPFSEAGAHLSPNGRWVAYVSDESGRSEVYVREFSTGGSGGKWQVSSTTGQQPSWSADGKTIYFVAGDGKLMGASVDESNGFTVGDVHTVLSTRMRTFLGLTRNQYDVSRDGKTFVVNTVSGEGDIPAAITLVQNWTTR